MNSMSRRTGAALAAVVFVLATLLVVAAMPRGPGTPGTPATPGPSSTAVAQASHALPPVTSAPAPTAPSTATPVPTLVPDTTPTVVPDPTPAASAAASPTGSPPQATPTTVFFQSWGSGHHRLYRWPLDGVTKPEILLDRPVPLGDEGGAESYSVSPDGFVALAVRPSIPGSVTAFDLLTGVELWSENTEGWAEVHLWSTDSAVAMVIESDDDVSTWQRLDIATGARSPIVFPDDWELLGFERGTHSILLSDVENGRAFGRRFLLIDLETGAQRIVGPGDVELGTASPTLRVSPLLGVYAEIDRPGDGVRAVFLTNAATGEVSRAEIPGARSATFDPTGGHVLVWADEGTDQEPRAALYDWQPGIDPVRVWEAEASAYQEVSFALDGPALVFRSNWRVPSFSFVDLATRTATAIPLPTDIHQASPVAVIAGTSAPRLAAAPFPEPQADPAPERPLGGPLAISGDVTGSAPALRLELTGFAATDSGSATTLVTASFPLPRTASTEVEWRVLREDERGRLTIWVYSLKRCCQVSGRLWTWIPGFEPRREPFPARMRPAHGLAISPDGRWVAGSTPNQRAVLLWDRSTGAVTNARLTFAAGTPEGWTADGRSLVLYQGYGIEGQCLTGGTVSLFDLRTHRSGPYRGQALLTDRGATYAPWGAANAYERRNGRSFWAGDYCAGGQQRVPLPSGLHIDQVIWSGGGSAAFVLVRDARDGRHLLRYRAGRAGLDRTPQRLALGPVPWDQIVSIETVIPGGRWLVVQGEGRYAVGRSGLVNLRTGAIAWLPYGSDTRYAFTPRG